MKANKKVGRKPYGSTPCEKEIIRKMRRYRNIHHGRRKTFCQIAALLNTQGIEPPAGKKWYPTTIQNILERLAGKELLERQKKTLKHLDPTQVTMLWGGVCRDAESGPRRYRQRKAIIAIQLFAGLRNFELTDLQYRDLPVKHGRRAIIIRRGKRKKYGEVEITKHLCDVLGEFIGRPKSQLRDTDWVFKNEAGKKYSTNQIWKIIKRVGRKQNLDFLHPHCLRHTYATILLADTDQQHFVRRQLRHKSSGTTDIYIGLEYLEPDEHLTPEILRILRTINPRRRQHF